jgi:hypothetical protein
MTLEKLKNMAERILQQKQIDKHGLKFQNPSDMYLTGFEDGFLEGVKYVSNQVNATAKNIREMN